MLTSMARAGLKMRDTVSKSDLSFITRIIEYFDLWKVNGFKLGKIDIYLR